MNLSRSEKRYWFTFVVILHAVLLGLATLTFSIIPILILGFMDSVAVSAAATWMLSGYIFRK